MCFLSTTFPNAPAHPPPPYTFFTSPLDEVERPKAMIEAVVETRTRLIEVEFKQWRKLRCRDYLSKQRMRRQFRGGLLIVS